MHVSPCAASCTWFQHLLAKMGPKHDNLPEPADVMPASASDTCRTRCGDQLLCMNLDFVVCVCVCRKATTTVSQRSSISQTLPFTTFLFSWLTRLHKDSVRLHLVGCGRCATGEDINSSIILFLISNSTTRSSSSSSSCSNSSNVNYKKNEGKST